MLRLKKYLKPFLGGLAVCLILLFAQAICDLNLPNYMSDIVNVGIQQNGVENGAPEAVSSRGMDLIKSFATDEENLLLDRYYQWSDAGKTAKFPNSVSGAYFLENADTETSESLGVLFGKAVWRMIYTLREVAAMQGMSMEEEASGFSMGDIDMERFYQIQPMISTLPASMLEAARLQAETLDPAVLAQTSAVFTGAFYRELGVDMGKYQSHYILGVGAKMLLIALISGAATVTVSFLSSRIAAGVARNLRNDIYARVSRFSNNEFDRFSTASLITRSTNDVMQIQMVLAIGIRMICYAPFMGVGGIVMALGKSLSMSWIIAAAVTALVGLIIVAFSLVMPKLKSMQKLVDRLNLVARESLNGLMVIRAFRSEKFEENRFDTANKNLAGTNLFVNRVMSSMFPFMMLIMNGVTLLVIWVGAHQVAESAMQVGDMIAFMQYAMQIIMSFLMISMMFIFIPRAAVSAVRIAEVLETEPEIVDPVSPAGLKRGGKVEFRNVCFRYHGAEEDALKNITFTASPGETVAFIGATGAGKTTLANLIPRFYEATSGEVLVNGLNVKDVSQKELRSHIGYVPQKSVLMSGTIASNIKYGAPDASEETVRLAAEVAQAAGFIAEKEDSYDSAIAQGGANVSGGQRQRLAIARALAVHPDIYIFDDSFSALDFKTDAALRAALKGHTADSTILIIAQRVSTIMDASRIYVLENGEIIGGGTHRQLLENCPAYYEIASSQLSKEELEK